MQLNTKTLALLSAGFVAGAVTIGISNFSWSQNAELAVQSSSRLSNKLLTKRWWFYMSTNEKDAEGDVGRRHIDHQIDLEKRGIMFGAGPVFDAKGTHEYGLIMIRADNTEEAKAIADSDPMHQTGTRTYTLHQWSMNEGHIDVGIDFSNAMVTLK